MTTPATYTAPTGSPIQGTMNRDHATRWIEFVQGETNYTGLTTLDGVTFGYTSDEPDADWTPIEVAGSPVFVDDSGECWLWHHLIAADTDELPHDVTTLFQRELALGEAWEAAKGAVAAAGRALTTAARDDVASIVVLQAVVNAMQNAEGYAQRAYAPAKRASIAAKREHVR